MDFDTCSSSLIDADHIIVQVQSNIHDITTMTIKLFNLYIHDLTNVQSIV